MNRFCLFFVACIMAVVASGCGDNADEANDKCKDIGPRCDNGVAINCRATCSMLGECSPSKEELTCANGAQCGIRPKSEFETVEWAYCIAQPETACNIESMEMHKSCPTPTSVKACDFDANLVVSYECKIGSDGALPNHCSSSPDGSETLVCKF